ncbi:3'(2'),5'-bisphosphate nucleotidase CysQ [Microvirga lotononidis]|uniref:Inositol monophosphatase/fructose-1,6-bisphosphatase family protein n=1 Tax=Microvirga lotononidis TaxID=864069 RepID=I4YV27_9HYPH|nr:3'(2'),5'-bisphosphate nucleotidase CysQ [Microvirga lotononidis]EIM27819.1 inositol monophosphatase/fructose-1,6-bisphosphatase family protein [Microvirga lotononidis]WQO28051.1 3'(2'),5'-bisphosphate nucleotidase CysQ [Microvirga lotononidis]
MLSSSPQSIAALAPAVRDAARQAGELALPYYRAGAQTAARLWYKGQSSPVTEADIALDVFLKEHLSGLFPEAGWLSEETADDPSRLEQSYVWIVDPIDGTRAFASGHADWAISIALVKDGRPVLGVLHAPIHERLYEARIGEGAWCNGERLALDQAGGTSPARVAGPKPLVDRLERRMGPVERLPKVPSLALRLARVAEGTIDIGLVSANAQDWDIAAADLILQEAGGCLTGFDGSTPIYNRPQPSHDEMIAVASRLHPRAIGAMRA